MSKTIQNSLPGADEEFVLDYLGELFMNEVLLDQAEEISNNIQPINGNSERITSMEDIVLGVESEGFLTDERTKKPVSGYRRNLIAGLENSNQIAEVELGEYQFEIGTDVVKGKDCQDSDLLSSLKHRLGLNFQYIKDQASEHGAEVIRVGTNPLIDHENLKVTDRQKYIDVPKAYKELRGQGGTSNDELGRKETVDVTNELLPTATAATQLNMQMGSMDQGIDLLNHLYQLSGFIYAFGGNGRLWDGKDLSINDGRILGWQDSFDIRDEGEIQDGEPYDVGELGSYVDDWEDYVGRLLEQPRILSEDKYVPAAFDVANGMFWKDARLKIVEEDEEEYQLILEARQGPQQPTVEEEMGLNSYVLGRVLYNIENDESLMNIEKANSNRETGMYDGMGVCHEDGGFQKPQMYDTDGELRWIDEVLEQELDKAEEGLKAYGLETEYLEPIRNRLEGSDEFDELMNPSRMSGKILEKAENPDREDFYRAVTENQVR